MDKYSSDLSFIDFLFNLLLVFVSLFVLSFLLINPKEENKSIEPKGEFMIVMTWPSDIPDDIDLWVKDPAGGVVFFNEKDSGLMHLDRDDLGDLNDRVETKIGTIKVESNQEMVMVRGFVPGEYIVNAHVYTKRSQEPNPVSIQVIKLKPFGIIHEETYTFTRRDEERTMCRFTLDQEGRVIRKNLLQKRLTVGGRR